MTIANAILIGLRLAEAVAAGIPEAIEAKHAVDRLLDEGRDPTEAEWEALTATTEALHRQIQEA